MTPHQFDVHLRTIPASDRIATIEARDAAIRASVYEQVLAEARRYAALYKQGSDGRNTFLVFADWAERRAGIGKEKGDG